MKIVLLFSIFSTVFCQSDLENFVLKKTGISIRNFLPNSKRNGRAWLDGLIPTATGNVSAQCKLDSVKYRDELAISTDWAEKMFDATGKMPDGVLNGNWHALGDFEECLRVQPENLNFRGKYCQVFLWIVVEGGAQQKLFPLWASNILASGNPLNPGEPGLNSIQPSLGVCLPSSCSALDITTAMTAMSTGEVSLGGYGYTATTAETFCAVDTDGAVDFDSGSISMLSVLSVIGFFIVCGTALDIIKRCGVKRLNGFIFRWFTCFSIVTNGSKLLSTKSSGDNLSCIHGIRFISFTWVVIGHAYLQTYFPTRNYGLLLEHAKNTAAFQVIGNAYVSVDTFLFMTGLLLAFLYLKAMKKTGTKLGMTLQVNPLMLTVHRFLRLTPAYALILGFYVNIWPLMFDGPGWGTYRYIADACYDQWWGNLLYVQNLVFDTPTCMGVTWYLAAEFQTFVVATVFVWLMHRFEFIGVAATAVVGFGGAVLGAVYMAVWDMPPTGFLFDEANSQFSGGYQYSTIYYLQPWFRYPPFFVGMLFGWLLYKVMQPTYVKPRWMTPGVSIILSVIGWLVSAAIAAAIIYGLYDYTDGIPEIPQEVQVIYGGFHRYVWAICMGWVVFACVTGYGGPINKFLSWKPFIVLGRLTFCGYLIHFEWIALYLSHARTPMYYTTLTMTYMLVGHVTVTLVLSCIASLAFESPFLNLEKWMFEPSKPRKDLDGDQQSADLKHDSSIRKDSDISKPDNGSLNPGFQEDEDKL